MLDLQKNQKISIIKIKCYSGRVVKGKDALAEVAMLKNSFQFSNYISTKNKGKIL